MKMFPLSFLLLLLTAGPALAGPDSLVLRAGANTVQPGGTVEIEVLARVYPEGRALIPLPADQVNVTVQGEGSVAPASSAGGETRFVYRAPATVRGPSSVTITAKLRAHAESAGSLTLRIDPPPVAPLPAAGGSGSDEDADDDGELVQGASGSAAEAVGKLAILVRWRMREDGGPEWKDRKIPPRGEELYGRNSHHEIQFRVNSPWPRSVEILYWRSDRVKEVRRYTESNKRLTLKKDQDGFVQATFRKTLPRAKDSYTFQVVVTTSDGKVLRENIVIHRDKPADAPRRR